MCELFLSPLLEMGFSYILQFSHLLHLCRSSTDKFPLDTDSEQIVNHLQEIYAQVVIQQCCYYSLFKSLKSIILSFYLLVSPVKLLEEVVPDRYIVIRFKLNVEPVIVEGKTPVDHCLDVFKLQIPDPPR